MIVPKKLIEKWRVLSVILIASSIILAGGAYYYNYSIKLLRKQKENELYVIAKYKIAQMQQWKVERTADIKSIAESPFFEKGVEEWLLNRASEYVKEGIKESLDAAKNILDYEDVFLTSKTGVMLIGKDGFGKKGEPELIATINYAAEKNYTVHSDFYYCSEHKKIHYDIVAPIHNAKNEVIACIVFRIDPYDYMYPLIQSWPTESKTAETLLFKKEGDYVLYLNELRHKTNTALKFRLPLAADKLPAAQAIKGTTGFFTGIDYRGVEVISYLSPISGTEWYIVAKVDSDEILAAVKERSFLIIVIVLLLLLSVSSGIIWLYYYRQRNIYRNLNLVQEEFKTTLYSIGDAVISTDKEGRVKNMNKVAETLTGWSEKDAYGKKLTEVFVIINEVTREIVESPVEKVLLNGEVVDLANHTVLISKDGQEYQIADSAAPIKNHAGEITGIVMVFSDVTEKYLKDQKVRESERVLSTLVSNLPGMAYRCANDYDWTMRFISDSCYKITGYYASDFIDNKKVKFNDIILEEYRELLWEEWQKVLSAKETFTYEYKIRKANGEIRWVWERGLGVYDDSGKLLFLEGYIEDINERKVAEEELRKSREELVKFFEDDVAANLISTPGVYSYLVEIKKRLQ
ncbi:MAG: PAS domain S-box [Ignavibacteria bacterium]|nr:MAG: PAS domain S-box [Ignavibacteria bacterium]KAF0155203.1 MAG: PAS domain S-box [Ignavibacteria bacterium]